MKERIFNMLNDWSRFDLNKNGDMTAEEVSLAKDLIELELREEKALAQKNMAWVALIFLILYSVLPIIPYVTADRLSFISDMSGVVMLSFASIIGFYFGATAYMSKPK